MKTLEFKAYDILQKYNFSKEDAEALIEYMKEASREEIATKKDINKIESELDKVRSEIKVSTAESKTFLMQWTTGLMLGQIAIIFSLLKLFDKI